MVGIRKHMNVDEALIYLENLEVLDNSETKSEDEMDFVARGELVILPLEDHGAEESGEDSGDDI